MSTETRPLLVLLIAAAGLAFLPSPAFAYIGPGAGLSAIGSLLALVAAGVVGLFGFVWFPVKRVLRLMRSKRPTGGRVGATAGERKS